MARRIVDNVWRYRRFCRLEAQVLPFQTAFTVSAGSNDEGRPNPFLSELTAVLKDIQASDELSPSCLPASAPRVWERICIEAEAQGVTPQTLMDQAEGGITGYLDSLFRDLLIEIENQKTKSISAPAREEDAGNFAHQEIETLEKLGRYQVGLNNALVKLLRELRAEQDRRRTIEGVRH